MEIEELPLFTYEIEEEEIYLNLIFHCKKERIKLKELTGLCGICLKEYIEKEYAYFFKINDFVCLNCLNNCLLKTNLKYENILDQFFQKCFKLEKEFKILNIIDKKFYGIFSFLLNLFKVLKIKGLFDKNLNINLNLFISVNWNKLSLIYDNYKIILNNGSPIILFNEFYGIDFINYYGLQFLEYFDIIEVYKKNNINFKEININFILMNIKSKFDKNLIEYKLETEKKFYELKLKATKSDYDLNLSKLENLIYNYYSGKEIIPTQYILKRKLAKLILDSLFSVYYPLLKDEPEPNYCKIFYFYERILRILKIIQNSNLKEKLEQVHIKLKKILLNKNLNEKKNLESYDNDDIIEKFEKIEFTDEELNELIKIGTQVEKERKEKCNYYLTNEKYILLKLTISYLNFVRERANLLIHILLEKYSENFYFKEINNIDDLKKFIINVFSNETIQSKIQLKECINYFFFQDSQNTRIKNILDNINSLILSEINKNKCYDKELFDKKQYIQNLGNDEIRYYKRILNSLKQPDLKSKENRIQYIYNKLILSIITLISEEYNTFNLKMKKFEKIKEEIILDIEKIILNNQLNELITELIKDIKFNINNNYSFENLFDLWKENEKKKIFLNLEGIILKNVNEILNNLNLEDIKNFLIQFCNENPNIKINLYEEELDLNLSLFLYKNGINPLIAKINYN